MEKPWKELLAFCADIKDPKLFDEFFELFLTHEERKDLALRWALCRELIEGKRTQRQIAERLGVSIAKITRGSNALKLAKTGLKHRIQSY